MRRWHYSLPLQIDCVGGLSQRLLLVACLCCGCGRDDRSAGNRSTAAKPKPAVTRPAAREVQFDGEPLEPIKFKTIPVKVYTPEPGFYVLIDGEPVRTEQGRKLKTPCEVDVLPGNHNVAVVREKYADASQEVLISGPRTLEFRPSFQPFAAVSGYFASRFALADAGVPVPLATLNTDGPVWDPFLSADGLTIWFAGDRSEGKGIYTARRSSIHADFDTPELLLRNADAPASPSVSYDQLIVAYTVLQKSQVRSLVRDETGQAFRQGPPLVFSEREGERWLSALLAGDGRSLYVAREHDGRRDTVVVRRRELDEPFGSRLVELLLPGNHPRLSHDGLRQYLFDGEQLQRSSRRTLRSGFSRPELVAELKLKNFVLRDKFRQWCLSDDQQWLYYTDDPHQSGNLWAVRISNGPAWGYAPRGKLIPQIELARSDDEPEEPNKPTDAPAANVVPEKSAAPNNPLRALPYLQLQQQLQAALLSGDIEAARKIVAAARNDAQFENDREVLAWDAEDIEHVGAFWNRLRETLAKAKPGDAWRLGSTQVEISSFSNDSIEGKVKTSGKPFSRAIQDLTPTDLVRIADRTAERNDPAAQLQIGVFLAFDPKSTPPLVSARLQRAGEAGRVFAEHRQGRRLHVIKREFARENIANGLRLVDELVAEEPKSEFAGQAKALREKLYAGQQWRAVGGRRWKTSDSGEYSTEGARSPNSVLMSPREYGNFHLELEWKITDEVAHGGVWFRFNGKREIRGNAFKIHVANDYDLRGQPDRFSTGSLFGIKGPRENPVRRLGEWNALRMIAQGDRVQVAINGVPVLDTPATDTNIGPKGFVCLDGEVPGITYRRVLVYELPSDN